MDTNINANPILGFDELFEDGIIVDGTGVDLLEVDKIMNSFHNFSIISRKI